jgi:predicted RNA-binding protein with PUA-like domain
MKYWLVKTEPETYSWSDFEKRKVEVWDGVRNYQARNNLNEMKQGDLVLFYHSGDERRVMGISKVAKESYQDPGTDDARWRSVDLEIMEKLPQSVSLAQIKADERLQQIALVKQSRLSVMPLNKDEFDLIVSLGYASE